MIRSQIDQFMPTHILVMSHKVTLRCLLVLRETRGVVEGGGRFISANEISSHRVLPENIVAEFQVDVTPLKIGQSLCFGLELDGIIPLDSLNRTIVTIRPPKGQLLKDVDDDEGGEDAERTEGSLEESNSEE